LMRERLDWAFKAALTMGSCPAVAGCITSEASNTASVLVCPGVKRHPRPARISARLNKASTAVVCVCGEELQLAFYQIQRVVKHSE